MVSSRLQSFLLLLVLAPLSGFAVEPNNSLSQSVAQTISAGKNQADKLIKEGEELRDRNQLQAALKKFLEALNISRQNKNLAGEDKALNNIGNAYADLNQTQQAISYYQQVVKLRKLQTILI